MGQLDLVLALNWIMKNIAEFGGDASRVLIFGQSGGGAKCAALMAMPVAKDTFQRRDDDERTADQGSVDLDCVDAGLGGAGQAWSRRSEW